ncbi:hypothetical protein N7468_004402 [Penicillium chermesinum]|uniref:Uncharacterized protein n=1 Tax=Penicillium chermesinum TaxID=63820 RepID=A0A9W9TT58_9EURO|nr:uncharacterized protein N7468_004402 [Penicillium chermesinum]KAJ5239783.1 hypothetical protein N7468_004402 [Penicillium chermesinum]
MHFSYASAFLALSSVSVTYAAPFEAAKRQDYSVVNVDGESTTAPTVETVTQTISSIVTEPGSVSTIGPQTITVTATPSSVPYSSGASSSTPVWHFPPPPRRVFLPSSEWLHSPCSSAAAVTTATPSSSVSLIARRWGWSSVSTPAYSATSTVTPTASASLYARGVSSSAPASSTRYAVRRAYGTPASSITGSATPASSWSVTPTFAPLH